MVQEGFTMDPQQVDDQNMFSDNTNSIINQKEVKTKSSQKQQPVLAKKDESIYMTIIIAILTAVILLLAVTMCVIMNRKRGRKFLENALKASNNANGNVMSHKSSLYTTPTDICNDNYHYEQQHGFLQKKKYMDIEALQTNNNCTFPVTDSLLERIDDYQEPYQAMKYAPYYSYSTVNMELQV